MSEKTFTKDNFSQEVLESKEVVLVDFWAPWCGPCRMMSVVISELSQETNNKGFKIGKLNVDEYPEIAEKYNIMSIPALFIFKSGKAVEKLIGLQNKDSLKSKLNKHL